MVSPFNHCFWLDLKAVSGRKHRAIIRENIVNLDRSHIHITRTIMHTPHEIDYLIDLLSISHCDTTGNIVHFIINWFPGGSISIFVRINCFSCCKNLNERAKRFTSLSSLTFQDWVCILNRFSYAIWPTPYLCFCECQIEHYRVFDFKWARSG